MHQGYFLIVTAIGEGGTGLLLLVLPSVPQALLLGIDQMSPEASFFARIAGAALVFMGMACWLGRGEPDRIARQGLLAAVLIYDVAAAVILAYVGWFVNLSASRSGRLLGSMPPWRCGVPRV
jgi:hypothetical protein